MNIGKSRKIKQLISQIKNHKADAEMLKLEISNKQNELSAKQKTIETMQQRIDALQTDNRVRITEHAVLRYLERVRGINIKDVYKEILTPEVQEMIDTLGGSGKFPNKDFQLVMKDYVVTTIVTPNKNDE